MNTLTEKLIKNDGNIDMDVVNRADIEQNENDDET